MKRITTLEGLITFGFTIEVCLFVGTGILLCQNDIFFVPVFALSLFVAFIVGNWISEHGARKFQEGQK